MPKYRTEMLTDKIEDIERTISDVLNISRDKALTLENVISSIVRLPLDITIHHNKVFGKWICTNLDIDEWTPSDENKTITFGDNFIFVDDDIVMSIARAVHYYFHKRGQK